MTMKPCADCGEPSEQSRCDEHRREARRHERKDPEKAAGYDHAWKKLSRRARKLQPFCEVCGTTDDLQCDHTPAAWQRREQGLAIRLQDVRVLCGKHNREAGAARGTNVTRQDGGGMGLVGKAHQPDAKARDASHTPGGIPDDPEEAL